MYLAVQKLTISTLEVKDDQTITNHAESYNNSPLLDQLRSSQPNRDNSYKIYCSSILSKFIVLTCTAHQVFIYRHIVKAYHSPFVNLSHGCHDPFPNHKLCYQSSEPGDISQTPNALLIIGLWSSRNCQGRAPSSEGLERGCL